MLMSRTQKTSIQTPHCTMSEVTPSTHPSADLTLVLKVIPMPSDCNAYGDIFGGWVMAQVDLAGWVLPAQIVQGRLATVAVNEFVFKEAVRVGDVLSFYAKIVRIGNTSITVYVEVFSEHIYATERMKKVTQATLTYVALDDKGKPKPVNR
jgi:acyl-CoA thioesterase YciA